MTSSIQAESYLTFQLNKELYALHVSQVLNILELMRITEVPQAPPYIKGVINLRGEVLPVIDTRIKLGMSPIEMTKNTCILTLELQVDNQQLKAGALVDSVLDVIEVKPAEIQPPPSIGSRFKTEFIEGMIQKDDAFIMQIDMNKIFSADDLFEIAQANTQEA